MGAQTPFRSTVFWAEGFSAALLALGEPTSALVGWCVRCSDGARRVWMGARIRTMDEAEAVEAAIDVEAAAEQDSTDESEILAREGGSVDFADGSVRHA